MLRKIACLIFLSLALPAQAQAPAPALQTFTFTLSVQDANIMLRALQAMQELAARDAAALHAKLQQQAQDQIDKANQPIPPPKAE